MQKEINDIKPESDKLKNTNTYLVKKNILLEAEIVKLKKREDDLLLQLDGTTQENLKLKMIVESEEKN